VGIPVEVKINDTRKFKLGVIGRIVSEDGTTLNCMENIREIGGVYVPLLTPMN
jgi:RNase P/RNase MRP subunit p29